MGQWETFERENPFPDLKLSEKIWTEGRSTFFHTAVFLREESTTVDLTVRLDEFLEDRSPEGADRCNEFMDKVRGKVARRARAIREISGPFTRRMCELEVEFELGVRA